MFKFIFASINWLWIVIPIIFLILVILLIILLINNKKRKSKQKVIDQYYETIIESVGGLDNVQDVTFNNSRLTFILKNNQKLDEEKLKSINITGIFKMSSKITLIVGKMSEQYYENIKKHLNSEKK